MSSAIVLPDLQNFVQQRITALYTAPSAEAFAEAFDSFVGQHAHITVNGRKTSRAAYQKLLLGEVNGDLSATVTFGDVVAVPADPEGQDLNKIGTGTVGAFFRANIVGRIIVLGSRESKTVTSSFNVTYVLSRRSPA
ncbi:uncharacterized protein BXZ73DRAFT_49798 [Epithele typhae]|uniref:uncharacterized protein n=1 Tax=Epithele typhae TaxID=378194 RepID=UPI0020074EB1|nr:uncharacterized protein BXZ73DRAFT_49798 [Epithele typhae]KAH9925671.1 hypothetical protein BXZ73DRAFT_49798 [Epithele typhae]